jgi:3-oxoacyl-[acyl-carrier protein] reductase
MSFLSKIKKNFQIITRKLKKKIPVYIPVLQGSLLCGRTALITGGTSGIGFSIAKVFLQNGATVVITGRSQERMDTAVNELRETRDCVSGFVLDNSNIKTLQIGFQEIVQRMQNSKIDILVNNAGINKGSTFGRTAEDDFDEIINSNLKGAYFLSQIVSQYMKEQGIQGNILNISSSSSLRPGNSPYILSKWGIKSLTLGMAKSLIPYGIVVNALAPGPTHTPMLCKDGYEGIELNSNPSGRYGTSEEVANLAVILVSSLGRLIVGDTLYMTGGAGVITYDDVENYSY